MGNYFLDLYYILSIQQSSFITLIIQFYIIATAYLFAYLRFGADLLLAMVSPRLFNPINLS